MNQEYPTRYDFEEEPVIYEEWERGGYFRADNRIKEGSKKPFVIAIPPPNVTGALHIGHALNNTLQDVLIRYKKMCGDEVLWIPGTDHAGIATQNVVEKELAKENLTRFQLGREKFIESVWQWKEKYGNTIINQLKRLGCACDWSRTRFTMDEDYSRAIRESFVRLFKKGYIYQGEYVINWCPRCLTALSDIEVEHEEIKSNLWYVKYPLENKPDEFITVATTRPETILGDTAVAVNPNDERYKSFVGKIAILPFVNRKLPIIADYYVDKEFGTGAVKVTPAHDVNDFEIARRHNLEIVVVMTPEGKMNENAGKVFKGFDRFECRKKIVDEFKKLGLLLKIEDYNLSLSKCYRCHTILEPYLSKQWFVKMKPLAERAIEVVRNGEVKFYPERFTKVYIEWLENTRDWCVSRQIWWGHRIPVWKCRFKGCEDVLIVQTEEPKRCLKCGSSIYLEQESDVLDTWFSSAIWPYATLGWPKETQDSKKFFPTSTLVTARDIIYLWVARMIMTSLEFLNKIPFDTVVINPTIRTPEGRRMSKSLGTGVDPLDLIERYGADVTRLGLAIQVTESQDIRFFEEKIVMARNFITKLWNASRFVITNYKKNIPKSELLKSSHLEDKWILARFNKIIKQVNDAINKYRFGEYAQTMYDFLWHDYCDWYLEIAKRRLKEDDISSQSFAQSCLSYILVEILKLLHPVVPFVTENIYKKCNQYGVSNENQNSIFLTEFPIYKNEFENNDAEKDMNFIIQACKSVRQLRADFGLKRNVSLNCEFFVTIDEEKILNTNNKVIERMENVNIKKIESGQLNKREYIKREFLEGNYLIIKVNEIENVEDLKNNFASRMVDIEARVERLNDLLNDEKFLESADPDIIEKNKQKRDELKKEYERIRSTMNELMELS